MSWGVQLKTWVFVPRTSKENVSNKIEENIEMIEFYEKEILMMISSSPDLMVSENALKEGETIQEILTKTNEIFDSYKRAISENTLLNIIKEKIEEAEDA